jgi:hypothetical protein
MPRLKSHLYVKASVSEVSHNKIDANNTAFVEFRRHSGYASLAF